MKKYLVILLVSLIGLTFLSCSSIRGRKIVPLILDGVKTLNYPDSVSIEPTDDILDYLYSASFHMKENIGIYINIIGQSDNSGSYEENITRSIKMAEKCNDYLISLGIDKYRINYSGVGNMSPLSNENTDEAKAKNRRVEIRFYVRE